jgi:hypothetical protein
LPSKTTYHWDNVGFDGPVLPVPRSYEIPDNTVRGKAPHPDDHPRHPGPYLNLGYLLGTERGGKDSLVKTIKGVDLTGAKSASITLNAWEACSPTTLDYRLNDGAWRSFKLPYPSCDHAARAVLIPVALGDLKSGDNKLEMYANRNGGDSLGVIVSNAELLVDAE